MGNYCAHVVYLRKRLEQRNHFEETAVVWVVVPAENGHGVFGVEEVSVGAVVDNNDVTERTAQQREVLDVGALVAEAVVAEQPEGDQFFGVNGVHKRVRVYAHRSRVDH